MMKTETIQQVLQNNKTILPHTLTYIKKNEGLGEKMLVKTYHSNLHQTKSHVFRYYFFKFV